MPIAIINPATGETEKEFEAHDAAEIELRLALAEAAFRTMRGTTFAQRAEWMNTAADLVDSEVEQVAEVMTREMGKPITAARAEAAKCAKGMRFYAAHAEAFLAEEPLENPGSVNASR